MIWLVWRRCRAALLLALSVAALVAVALVVARVAALAAARDLGAEQCLTNPGPPLCPDLVRNSQAYYNYEYTIYNGSQPVWLTLIALPAVVGGIAGAGLFGREFEQRTHVFALTQSLTRTRWWVAGLVVAGIPAALAVAAVTAVAAWAIDPFSAVVVFTPLQSLSFLTTGVVPIGYTLLAFVIAANAGLVLRSTLGALAVTAAVQIAVLLLLSLQLRDHYLPPETWRAELLPPGQGDIVWEVPPRALAVELGYLDREGMEIGEDVGFAIAACPTDGDHTFTECLRRSGITGLFTRYQPDTRYWPFQAIETAVLGLLAAVALTGGRRGLRRNRT